MMQLVVMEYMLLYTVAYNDFFVSCAGGTAVMCDADWRLRGVRDGL